MQFVVLAVIAAAIWCTPARGYAQEGQPPTLRIALVLYVRSHTVRFISPVATERYRIPNPCTSCRTDPSVAWAIDELKRWPGTSPWRVAQ